MENNNEPEYEINLEKVLNFILILFSIIGVFALIWAQWKLMQFCASIAFLSALLIAFVPDKYMK